MDALSTPQKTRRSRWTRDAVLKPSGAAIAVYPTERDIEVFKVLDRFGLLPSDYIHAFVGGNVKALSRRLGVLSRKPNLYLLRPPQQRHHFAANHRPLVYQLDDRGIHELRARGVSLAPKARVRNFNHQVTVAQIMALIELGARQHPHVTLITWDDMLANERTPLETRLTGRVSMRVSFDFNSQYQTTDICADGRPFGIARIVGGARTYLFFPGIEADCATEPLDATDAARSSIARKFAGYLRILEDGIHRTHFGFPNLFVPFLTSTERRMDSMMTLLARATGGQGSKSILFRVFSPFMSGATLPTHSLFDEPWARVGHPPLYLHR
jgi:hypothetical protein